MLALGIAVLALLGLAPVASAQWCTHYLFEPDSGSALDQLPVFLVPFAGAAHGVDVAAGHLDHP